MWSSALSGVFPQASKRSSTLTVTTGKSWTMTTTSPARCSLSSCLPQVNTSSYRQSSAQATVWPSPLALIHRLGGKCELPSALWRRDARRRAWAPFETLERRHHDPGHQGGGRLPHTAARYMDCRRHHCPGRRGCGRQPHTATRCLDCGGVDDRQPRPAAGRLRCGRRNSAKQSRSRCRRPHTAAGALETAAPADVHCINAAPGADVVAVSHTRPPGSGAEVVAVSHARPPGTVWLASFFDALYLQLLLPLLVLLMLGRGQGRSKGMSGGARHTR